MEIDGERIIRKSKKAPKWIICGYILCLIVIAVAIYSSIHKQENNLPQPIDFTTDGAIGMAENQYAFFLVEGLSDQIAVYGDSENQTENERYYIAINNGYLYIVDLDLETIELLKSVQDYKYFVNTNETKPEPITIYGMTEEIPKELKQIILDICNERISEENKISIEDFDKHFGSVLLNVKRIPVDNNMVENIAIILAVIGIIILLILHISMKIEKMKSKRYLKKNAYEEELANQLHGYVEEDHYKHKVLLTKDFLVDVKYGGFSTFKFSDVKWVHIYNTKSYATVSSSIEIYLRDGKTNFECVEIKGNPTEEFWGIFDKICERVPADCLKGYTKANIKEFKEYKKIIKKKGTKSIWK